MDKNLTLWGKLTGFLKQNLDRTTGRFLLVGVINTLFGTSIMFLSYNLLHFSYWLSSALNYILGSILSYFLNKFFTFRSVATGGREVVRFILNIAFCYLVAYGIAKPLVAAILAGVNPVIQDNGAMLVGMCLFVGLNYFGQRYFVFKKK